MNKNTTTVIFDPAELDKEFAECGTLRPATIAKLDAAGWHEQYVHGYLACLQHLRDIGVALPGITGKQSARRA